MIFYILWEFGRNDNIIIKNTASSMISAFVAFYNNVVIYDTDGFSNVEQMSEYLSILFIVLSSVYISLNTFLLHIDRASLSSKRRRYQNSLWDNVFILHMS